jgi:outer membrane protein assembly factor BamD
METFQNERGVQPDLRAMRSSRFGRGLVWAIIRVLAAPRRSCDPYAMTRHSGLPRLATLLLLALTLAMSGCSHFGIGKLFGKHKDAVTETLPVDQLYTQAHTALERGNLTRAQLFYKRLIARFPFGPYDEQAQLDLAYAQFKDAKYDDAKSTIDRFIRTYPTHKHVDYAYYLRGLINYNRENRLLAKLARLDVSQRDQGAPRQSFNDFGDLLRRYPNSRYAADARQRMVYLREELAKHEISVGLYYLERGAYVAAANRGQFVIENYPQSRYDGDALALMAESYTRLGNQKLAADAKRVLQQNYPQHPWLSGNWPRGRGLLKRLNPLSGGQ